MERKQLEKVGNGEEIIIIIITMIIIVIIINLCY